MKEISKVLVLQPAQGIRPHDHYVLGAIAKGVFVRAQQGFHSDDEWDFASRVLLCNPVGFDQETGSYGLMLDFPLSRHEAVFAADAIRENTYAELRRGHNKLKFETQIGDAAIPKLERYSRGGT